MSTTGPTQGPGGGPARARGDPTAFGAPIRRIIRDRILARAGIEPVSLPVSALDVGGRRRTYSVVPAPGPGPAPLLVVLHGAGGTGPGMAALTGLADRAPAAGFAVAFPDGWSHVWNDDRGAPWLERRKGIDDVGFVGTMVARLVAEGVALGDKVVLVGMSNGAFLAEHVARNALLPLAGIVLVAGSASAASHRLRPTPAGGVQVVAFHGTADPLVPYGGGPIGMLGRLAQRRAVRDPRFAGRGTAVGIEAVAREWAAANGCPPEPEVERLATPADDLRLVQLTWRSPGRPSVTLFRIEGGGHTWPGGGQYLPARVVGARSKSLDASNVLLDAFAPLRG